MNDNAGAVLERLMALGSIENMENADVLKCIGLLVDAAGDLGHDDGLAKALIWSEALGKRRLTVRQTALLNYFCANAWANRQRARHRDAKTTWAWEQPELLHEVYHLRRAMQSTGFERLPVVRRCQILTNLGNHLSSLGRGSEALAMWTRALSANSKFGMALGNRGVGLMHYARNLFDKREQGWFLYFAHRDLTAALDSGAQYEGRSQRNAKRVFASTQAEIESVIDTERANRVIGLNNHSLGNSTEERSYRSWVLHERLFLNPLNDLGAHSMSAHDTLSLPSFVTPLDEPPSLIGFFNQMKQEFVSGRWLLYEGVRSRHSHFSDRWVTISNTLDYPSYGLAVEKLKAAYRTAYALFDKIAYFLNDYDELGIDTRFVYFKTVWYKDRDPRHGMRPELAASQNWPLRGLFWLAKDLFDPTLADVMEPEAQALYAIRNSLEHGYLKIHEILVAKRTPDEPSDPWHDRLAYSVLRSDFEAKTLHLFKLVRAAMIYLVLGMHREERLRRDGESAVKRLPMTLPEYRDSWKR